ncbi:MAG: hypothetical protein ACO1N0_21385 [Fluviicola sp.]
MNIIAIIISVITLVVSAITLRISIKNRRNNLRENIYNRQLDLYENLFSDIIELENLLEQWAVNEELIAGMTDLEDIQAIDEEQYDLEEVIEKTNENLDIALSKAQLLLPDEMADRFNSFKSHVNSVQGKIRRAELSEIELDLLSDKISDLEDDIRSFIGLEAHSRENENLGNRR